MQPDFRVLHSPGRSGLLRETRYSNIAITAAMKFPLSIIALCLLAFAFAFPGLSQADEKISPLEIGSPAPAFDLPGVDGKNHTLADYADADVLAVLFTCNHCPSAQGAESRVKKLVNGYAKADASFQLIAISPNDPLSVRLNELGYAVYGDTLEEMKKHARDQEFNFPYLYDGETQSVSTAYGCVATPHVFIFDKERKLRYQGRFDDSKFGEDNTVQVEDARIAIDALLAGKPVANATTRAHGCSTKWAAKRDLVTKYEEEHKAKKVTQEMIDADGVKKLVANDTDKLRLINLWASYCGPCLAEMPDLIAIGRQFETRGFDMILLSLDDPKMADSALKILQRNHAALPKVTEQSLEAEGRTTNNYLWAGGDADALAKVLDKDWDGGAPYTLIVAPGGKIVYQHSGEIDPDEVKRFIVSQLGRWYSAE